MCGIAGIFHYKDNEKIPPASLLESMSEALAHRGPDGKGIFQDQGIGFAHRRLAVIDTSTAGQQPMSTQDKSLWITYNGEIYNFKELRRELEAHGHAFYSGSDTEVILAAYREWGTECIGRFSGIFAFALWDKPKKSLWLARDPLGVKPLFYSDDGKKVVFASEIKAILRDSSISRQVNPEGIDAFFTFSYIPCPMTGLAQITQLAPGEWITFTRHGPSRRQYWQIRFPQQPSALSLPQATERFESLLTRVISRQMVSDVPLGIFLSGGLDSISIAKTIRKNLQKEITAFTVGICGEKSFDEIPDAKKAAEIFGIKLFAEYIQMDKLSLLKDVARHSEEPFSDSSMLAEYILCKMARKNVTVALSGDGADELLAGYDTYRAAALARQYRKIPSFIRRHLIMPLAKMMPIGDSKYNLHQIANRFVNAAEEGEFRDHCCWRIIASNQMKKTLYARGFHNKTAGLDPIGMYEKHLRVLSGKHTLNRLLYADLSFYLPNDMLLKVDRMSMASGLEVRVPFLDTELVEFCAQLPEEYKLKNGKFRKYILRKMLEKDVPPDILKRPKSGFNIPVESWFREKPVTDFFQESLRECADDAAEYLDLASINIILDDHRKKKEDNAHLLFTILMFFLWLRNIKEF